MVSLFSPLSIKSMNLRNRVVFPPIATNYGLRNDRAYHYYTERARGGAELVILQGTPIELLTSSKWIVALIPVMNSVHAERAAIGVQLWMGNELPDRNKVAPSPKPGYREVSAAELKTEAKKLLSPNPPGTVLFLANVYKMSFDKATVKNLSNFLNLQKRTPKEQL